MKTKTIAGIVILAILVVLVIAGLYFFSQIQEKVAFQNVEIDFEGVEIKDIDSQHITLNLNLRCYNPNKIPVTLDGADYEIYLQEIYVGNGSISERLTIPPDETKILISEVKVRYENLNQLLNIANEIIKRGGKVNITIKGNAYADFIGRISFPFKVEKEINLSREIVEKIKDLKNFKIF
ncbi:MAG: hypothetical protein GW779_04385 [Candidatus Altiarchaeum hamiconexum]|uniref:Water stress and hypersensitive response domain-containing protein n=1 Tax=Candidatus Altarchaeum hamiconexum TaxID=1803513 RepID=A0A8J7Z272_9ARCH|nr:hypothetical protein [Candidatus Altarchaeum hamiconexum]OIQ05095.1 MAG: hypothetical protein AUK59_05175 [Candidatus Altarchaeum sp. CG2_30_32_3053]PIN67818.1 MAG: hypothetical protein COV98_01450 [Candidatus Altarchaeum sp. CG12_big_fil_rev_8_21_14_0_65_33_22]PIV27491.1 MAG: hypothetical protein COS36_05530 [Candidatus Altarchaeum sp. CG03_land_8_20_14_0_80_32_618]PIX48178.1 MAG: hypothetical protein COZ53_04885 [Candidatus Altarchaeum sp. CG_4_8_14_3_um_filter_33_2054]PIZ29720.1 MAG: hyp